MKGNSKVAIIIPEIRQGAGWCDFAKKIRKFAASGVKQSIQQPRIINEKSYRQIAQQEDWPKDEVKFIIDDSLDKNQFRIDANSLHSRAEYHRKCLLG